MIKECYKPENVSEALALKKKFKENAVYLGGGTKINSGLKPKNFEKVISLDNLSFKEIKTDKGNLIIGSMVTLQDLVDNKLLPEPLKVSAMYTFSRNIRNMSTIGGNISTGDVDSYIVPALIALNAMVETAEKGIKPVYDFIQSNTTDLIQNIIIPKVKGLCFTKKVSRSCNSLPVINVATRINVEGDKISEAVIAVAGISDKITRLDSVEVQLLSNKIKSWEEIKTQVHDVVEPQTDIVGSAEYKKYITAVTVADCIDICLKGGEKK